MLHLQSSNGHQNIFSLDVYSSVVANTINSTAVNSENVQYTPNSEMKALMSTSSYYINMTEQATQKEYFSELGVFYTQDRFPRSKQFFLYLDSHDTNYHINIDTEGLYNYDVFLGQFNATSVTDSKIIKLVNSGIALVHNKNFVNDHFKNSKSGVQPLTIPTTISYNG